MKNNFCHLSTPLQLGITLDIGCVDCSHSPKMRRATTGNGNKNMLHLKERSIKLDREAAILHQNSYIMLL